MSNIKEAAFTKELRRNVAGYDAFMQGAKLFYFAYTMQMLQDYFVYYIGKFFEPDEEIGR
jgi:hypothetical protein